MGLSRSGRARRRQSLGKFGGAKPVCASHGRKASQLPEPEFAVAQQPELIASAILAERIEVAASIVVEQEDVLAVVPPLRNVVRYAHRHHASLSRHRFVGRILAYRLRA